MTFLNLSLGRPAVRTAEAISGELGGSERDSSCPVVRRRVASRWSSPRSFLGASPPRPCPPGARTSSRSCSRAAGVPAGIGRGLRRTSDLVYKPRDVWHTFWNATDRPARLLEIISPAGFEQLFDELAELLRTDPENVEANMAWQPSTASRVIWRRSVLRAHADP